MKRKKASYIVMILLFISIILIIFNIKIYIVKTGSMEPSLKINEMVIVKNRKKNTKYQIGDIITYKENGIIITHRISNIENEKIYTKGDNNNHEDIDYIKQEDIIGKVIWHTYLIGFLYSKIRLYHLIFILVSISIIDIYQAIEKRKKSEI